MHACVYSLSTTDYSSSSLSSPTEAFNNLRSPPFHGWQKTLLFILLIAQLLAILSLFSLCLSFHLPTRKLSAFIFIGFLAISGNLKIFFKFNLFSKSIFAFWCSYCFCCSFTNGAFIYLKN